MDVIEFECRLASLFINGRRVPLRNGGLIAVRRPDTDGLRDPDGPGVHSWRGWASAYNMIAVNGEANVTARSREGRWLEGPATVRTIATPTVTYLEFEGAGDGRLFGLPAA